MSHAAQLARMERFKQYEPVEQTWLTEAEYQDYLRLTQEHTVETPEMKAVLAKIQGRDFRGIRAKMDTRLFHHSHDMRDTVKLPPRPSEERYPSASLVSSHPHATEKSDTGKLYATDYFRKDEGESERTFVALQRRVDKTPLSPILGQPQALFNSFRMDAGVLPARQGAIDEILPLGYRQGLVRLSQA